jgi:hypothetical protein
MRSLYPVLALVAALAPGINVFDMFWLGTVIGDYDLWQLEELGSIFTMKNAARNALWET